MLFKKSRPPVPIPIPIPFRWTRKQRCFLLCHMITLLLHTASVTRSYLHVGRQVHSNCLVGSYCNFPAMALFRVSLAMLASCTLGYYFARLSWSMAALIHTEMPFPFPAKKERVKSSPTPTRADALVLRTLYTCILLRRSSGTFLFQMSLPRSDQPPACGASLLRDGTRDPVAPTVRIRQLGWLKRGKAIDRLGSAWRWCRRTNDKDTTILASSLRLCQKSRY